MNRFLAQVSESHSSEFLFEKISSDEMMAVAIVGIVFSTVLLMVIAVCVTRTIKSVCIAGSNSRMAEKLAQQGVPPEQIERIVRANWQGKQTSQKREGFPGGWRHPRQAASHPGKPV